MESLITDKQEILNLEIENGKLFVTIRVKSDIMYSTNPPRRQPDIVWKDVYGSIDGKIELIGHIEGEHIPSTIIKEEFKFGNDIIPRT